MKESQRTRKMIIADSVYQKTTYMYRQADVIHALGIHPKEGEMINIYCDGTNKVQIDIWKGVRQ